MIDTIFLLGAIGLVYLALQVLRDNNQLSSSIYNRVVGTAILVAAFLVLIWLYGTLAGIFIGIATVSLVGMLIPLVSGQTRSPPAR